MPKRTTLLAILSLVILVGCQTVTPTPILPSFTPLPSPIPATPSPTSTPLPPTPTPVPMAIILNNEGITLAEYESELLRLQAALKEIEKALTAAEQKQQVLEEFIQQMLLAQAAVQAGFKLDEAGLQQRIDNLAMSLGGAQALTDWQNRNHYTEAMLRVALRRSITAAYMRDTIINAVPKEAEQVHARQILVLDASTADRIYKQLEAGANFATVAFQIDAETGGDLGWFPKSYLLLPEIESIAFSLEAGKYSKIIKSSYGYHIVQVIEHHQSRPLSVNAYRFLQGKALDNWLKTAREKSQVKILV